MIRDLFEQFGKVVAIAPKGPYAFVEFETVEQSEDAIKRLHNSTQWGGKRLTVEYSNDPKTSMFSPILL
jgi:RNA recognition motif-containing protein